MNHENSLDNVSTLNRIFLFIEVAALPKYMHRVVLTLHSKVWQTPPFVAPAAVFPAERHPGGQAPITKGKAREDSKANVHHCQVAKRVRD